MPIYNNHISETPMIAWQMNALYRFILKKHCSVISIEPHTCKASQEICYIINIEDPKDHDKVIAVCLQQRYGMEILHD
jgi:hypothetical protein